ncbi:MAG: efflux RND transporter periplasmic adaptor subunit [Gammaproteobacteria bacterium]|nr:efflux RND transporter periplasmic adaptor subunit [Gammaproteobacteria bacterium]
MKNIRWVFTGVIALLLIAAAMAGFTHYRNQSIVTTSIAPAPISVIVNKATVVNVPGVLTAVGYMKAIQSIGLSFDVDGNLSKIYFNNGERVKAGDTVAELDTTVDQAQLAADQADLQLANATYQRILAIKDSGAISPQMLDSQKAQLLKARAVVAQQEDVIANKKFIAPFDGVLGDFQYNVGAFLPKGSVVVQLIQEAPLLVQFAVPVFYKSQVEIGQSVTVESSAYPNQTFKGILSYISPQVNPNSGTITLQAKVSNPDFLLLPGMFVGLQQTLNPNRELLMVPDVALMTDIAGQYVFKVVGSNVQKVYVSVGDLSHNLSEVTGNIKAGDEVVIAGQQKLIDGSKITIINKAPAILAAPSVTPAGH